MVMMAMRPFRRLGNEIFVCFAIIFSFGWARTCAAQSETSSAGENSPELKGLFLGMSERELLAKMPEFDCNPPEKWSGYVNLLDRVCHAKETSIAGQPANAVALFLGDRLQAVTFHPFSVASFPIIADALIEKYGPADDDVKKLSVTQGGNSVENRWLHWKLKSGHRLVAREHFNVLGSSGVRLLTPWAAVSINGFFLAPPKEKASSDL